MNIGYLKILGEKWSFASSKYMSLKTNKMKQSKIRRAPHLKNDTYPRTSHFLKMSSSSSPSDMGSHTCIWDSMFKGTSICYHHTQSQYPEMQKRPPLPVLCHGCKWQWAPTWRPNLRVLLGRRQGPPFQEMSISYGTVGGYGMHWPAYLLSPCRANCYHPMN